MRAGEGRRLREIRLEALGDPAAGVAFLETHATAAARDDAHWADRAATGASSDAVAQFIVDAGARWLATATVLRPEPGAADYFGRDNPQGAAQLVAVFVSADHRGQGLLGDLFAAAEEWASWLGSTSLSLDVHVRNARAQQAYRRLGFHPTGRTVDGPNGLELEMARAIRHG